MKNIKIWIAFINYFILISLFSKYNKLYSFIVRKLFSLIVLLKSISYRYCINKKLIILLFYYWNMQLFIILPQHRFLFTNMLFIRTLFDIFLSRFICIWITLLFCKLKETYGTNEPKTVPSVQKKFFLEYTRVLKYL